MAKNPTHLDNFKSMSDQRFAIVDVTNEITGTRFFEIASGKTKEQAIERFYSRFMFRTVDQEMMLIAQKNNRLKLLKYDGIHRTLLEDRLFLIA